MNIRYPIYEGVYRILAYHSVSELDYSKSGWFQTGSESRNNGSGKTS